MKLPRPGQFLDSLVSPDIEALLSRNHKPVGSFGYDAWGYNEHAVAMGVALTRLLYERYFRVQAEGLEHVPRHGRALIIANHSGQLPMDGLLLGYALLTNPHAPRAARAMIERFLPTVPWLGNLLNSLGGVIGDPVNCSRMLQLDETIVVFPEGIRGSGKPYSKRYQLQRFGNGFMHLAMAHDTPIIPVGIVGCEETMPSLGNIKPLARMLGIPYFPLAPLLPLPARVHITVGRPLHFSGDRDEEDSVTARVEQVKDAIRGLIDRGLERRGGRLF